MADSIITLDALDAQYSNNTTVTVIATATADGSVTQVEFFIDGVSIETDTSEPYSFSFSTSDFACGVHIVSATVTDNLSATATTATSIKIVLYLLSTDIAGVPTDWKLPDGDDQLNYTSEVQELNIAPQDMNLLPTEIQIDPDISYTINLVGADTIGFYFPTEPEVCEEDC